VLTGIDVEGTLDNDSCAHKSKQPPVRFPEPCPLSRTRAGFLSLERGVVLPEPKHIIRQGWSPPFEGTPWGASARTI